MSRWLLALIIAALLLLTCALLAWWIHYVQRSIMG